ncbi:hypothetical protein [Sphingomonas arenae]|uniref:hypothetical protein n=1 Tax=Sphingomonas arenae TaxID=2812555 RepID=UPI00196750BF|nr:hypothetical protein [Sphingomonas arenae]
MAVDPDSRPAEDSIPRPFTVDEDRIRLRGRPSELVGVMTVRRAAAPSRELFKVATTNLAETEFGYHQQLAFAPLASSSLPLDHAMPRVLSLGAAPPPGACGRVPVRFSVEPTTPPGRYEATFSVAGVDQVAEIEVLPHELLEISPRDIAISGPAGGVVHDELILRNGGNVPLDLDVLGVLVLQEEEQLCLSLQHALDRTKGCRDDEGAHTVFLDALASSLAARKTDLARVRLADGPQQIAPGDAIQARVAFHLPGNMIAGRQYRALMKAGTARLFVRITAEAGGVSTRPKDKRRQEAAA